MENFSVKRKHEIVNTHRISVWWSNHCLDQWTVVDLDSLDKRGMVSYIAMSNDPFHPQGVGITGEMPLGRVQYRGRNGAFDRRVKFSELNEDCQQCASQFLEPRMPENTVAVVDEVSV
jgi:hypothetical protein